MNLATHLFNRREVVAVFIDVDLSMLQTDLALPIPVETAAAAATRAEERAQPATRSTTTNATITLTATPSSSSNATAAVNGVREEEEERAGEARYTAPSTRFEVVREAVRSFIAQKERAAAHTDKLFFALYAVVAMEVVELLPPTQSGQSVIEAAFRRYLGKDSTGKFQELLSSGRGALSPRTNTVAVVPASEGGGATDTATDATSPTSSPSTNSLFPFHAVSVVLRGIESAMSPNIAAVTQSSSPLGEDLFALATSQQSATDCNGNASDATVHAGGGAMDVAAGHGRRSANRSGGGGGFLFVQGIVLLSRGTSLPVSSQQQTDSGGGAPSDPVPSSSADVWMDVVALDSLTQPPPPPQPNPPPEKKGSAEAVAPAVMVDVACTVIDPVGFTGITHRGLAVGPSLTKLSATHAHGTDAYLHRPIFTIELPTAPAPSSEAPPMVSVDDDQLAVQHRQSLPSMPWSVAPTTPAPAKAHAAAEGEADSSTPSPIKGITGQAARGAEGKGTTLPALQPEKPPGRRAPYLAGPLQGRIAATANGTSVTAGAAEPGRPHHFVRGTVVSGSNGSGLAPVNSNPTATATGGGGGGAGTAAVSAAPPLPTNPSNRSNERHSPATFPTLPKRSPSSAIPLLGKRQGLQLRSAVRGDNTGGSSSGTSALHVSNMSNTSNTSNQRHRADASGHVANSSGAADHNDSVGPAGNGLLSVQSSVYPSELMRREGGEQLSSSTPEERSSHDTRRRSESTGVAMKNRKQQVQQQREQYQQRRGDSLGSTPSPSATPTTTNTTTTARSTAPSAVDSTGKHREP